MISWLLKLLKTNNTLWHVCYCWTKASRIEWQMGLEPPPSTDSPRLQQCHAIKLLCKTTGTTSTHPYLTVLHCVDWYTKTLFVIELCVFQVTCREPPGLCAWTTWGKEWSVRLGPNPSSMVPLSHSIASGEGRNTGESVWMWYPLPCI